MRIVWLRGNNVRLLTIALLLGSLVFPGKPAQAAESEVRDLIRQRVSESGEHHMLVAYGLPLSATRAIGMFYHRRSFHPAWTADKASRKQISGLLKEIAACEAEGLTPAVYHVGKLTEEFNLWKSGADFPVARQADFDLLLTQAYLLFASHRLSGIVNPETYDPEWFSNRRESDTADYLESALQQSRVRASLQALKPASPDYSALEKALAYYRGLAEAGGWPAVSGGPTLEKGAEGARVSALLRRLRATGDYPPQSTLEDAEDAKPYFDTEMEAAVRRFQSRHGLEVDGKVGSRTLRTLNEPLQDRIERIEVNLERWRWLPEDLGNPHIRVNAANFQLQVIEDNKPVLDMRVIVGMPYRRTPVFSSRITYLVVNPYWYVTRNIAVQDKLPLIQKDPDYLEDNGFQVLSGEGANARILDADDIDWQSLSEDNFPYLLRQEAGPNNALGRVKFMFPNRYNVYLHDTPARELFSRQRRTLSSGCIRLEKPLQLADYLLGRDPKWRQADIRGLIESGQQKTLNLTEPVTVHLQYWTAWADAQGIVHFREDIYNRDSSVVSALRHKPVH